MSSRRWPLLPSALRLLLATTSVVVPRSERDEWIREWRAELHYMLGRGVMPRICIAPALGAFPDSALWLRRHSLRTGHWLESPRRCLAVLAVSAGLSLTLALLLPRVRQDIFPPKYDGPGGPGDDFTSSLGGGVRNGDRRSPIPHVELACPARVVANGLLLPHNRPGSTRSARGVLES